MFLKYFTTKQTSSKFICSCIVGLFSSILFYFLFLRKLFSSILVCVMCMCVLFFWIIAWDNLIPFNKGGDVGRRKYIIKPWWEVGDVFIKKKKKSERSRWHFYSYFPYESRWCFYESFGLILQNRKLICVISTVQSYLRFWGERLNFGITVAEIQPKVWERTSKRWREKMLNFGNGDTEFPLSSSAARGWSARSEKEKKKKFDKRIVAMPLPK